MRRLLGSRTAALSLCLFAILLLSNRGSSAQTTSQTVASEAFVYQPGPVDGLDGGSGFASPWTGAGIVTSPTLEWPQPGGSLGTGNKLTTAGGDTGASRRLGGRYGDDGTAVLIRFLVRGRPAGEQPDFGGIWLMDGSGQRLFVGKPAGSPNYGFQPAGEGAVFPAEQPLPADAEARAFLCEIYFGLGATPGNEQVYFSPEAPLRSAAAVQPRPNPPAWFAMDLDVPDFRFDTIRIVSEVGSMDFDEIRIHLVVPEPAAPITLAVAAGLCALHRRR